MRPISRLGRHCFLPSWRCGWTLPGFENQTDVQTHESRSPLDTAESGWPDKALYEPQLSLLSQEGVGLEWARQETSVLCPKVPPWLSPQENFIVEICDDAPALCYGDTNWIFTLKSSSTCFKYAQSQKDAEKKRKIHGSLSPTNKENVRGFPKKMIHFSKWL